jgi:hypothetical protein
MQARWSSGSLKSRVQLAAAIEANKERVANGLSVLVLVSADAELNDAALAEGFGVEDPNTHP